LIDALERRGVPFHLTHFEGSGVIMAATAGRLSGKAGLSLSIKGPGLTNAVPGLAAAYFEAFPVVHLAEATPASAPAAVAHKRLDQLALCGTVTKGARTLPASGEGFGEMAAWAAAEEPAPVLLQLADGAPLRLDSVPPPEPHALPVTAVIKRVRQASKPVVIAGALAVRSGWSAALEDLQVPVFCTAAAKGVVDERLPHAAGVYTGVGLALTPERHLLAEADLVVGLGLTAREVLAAKPFACPALNVEAVDTPGSEGFGFAERTGMDAFADVIEALNGKSWGVELLSRTLAALDGRMHEGHLPGCVFARMQHHFPDRARLVLDTGYFCTIGEHAWRARRAEWCLLAGQSRYMGTGLPMAIGASLHDRSVPTLAVLGDGGIAMYLAEAKLAVQQRLPLLILLMTDGSFSSIRVRSIRDGLTQKPLLMDGRSWVPAFEALGIPGTRAECSASTDSALASWKPADGPMYLEVPFEAESYARMVMDIRA
jgi:acetolactate synthase-1/2/3 large subunit